MSETNKNISQLSFPDYIPLESNPSSTSSSTLSDDLLEKYWEYASRNTRQYSLNNRRFVGTSRNSPYNTPQHNAHSRSFGEYENYKRKQIGPTKSFNSNFNYSYSRSNYDRKHSRNKREKTSNIMDYLHPSFMENPWAELEEDMINEKVSETDTEDANTSTNLPQSGG